jgi:restriction system protein
MKTAFIGALLILAGLAMVSATLAYWRRSRPNYHHRRMRGQSDRALERLQAMQPGAVISYIRKMHPHAVEELVLSAAEAAGHKVKRNRAYTGDGGIDGQIMVDGQWHLVQTKRYSSAINPAHVAYFSDLCRRRRQPGLFVHCGRTGNKSRANAAANVRFISGQAIVDLIAGQSLNTQVALAA